jgi:hypothetical protein
MDPQPTFTDILSGIEKRLESFMSSEEAQEQDSKNGEHKVFLGILGDACNLVRSDSSPASIEHVDAFLNRAVDFGYEGGDLFDYMPSFAHCEEFPEVKDTDDGSVAGMCAYIHFFISSKLRTHSRLIPSIWPVQNDHSVHEKVDGDLYVSHHPPKSTHRHNNPSP